MSEDMAAGDKATVEEAMNGEEASARVADAEAASSEPPSEPVHQQGEETAPEDVKAEPPELPDVKEDTLEIPEVPKEAEIKSEKPSEPEDVAQESPATETDQVDSTGCGIKRRASEAFSDDGGEEFKGFDDGTPPEEDFKGFESIDEKDASLDYTRIIERLEAEVEAAKLSYTPLKTVVAMAVPRASKRLRQDTDGSRPSSALSARSDGDGGLSNDGVSASSPMGRGRRATTEMSSPLLRVPLERGWKRELVYRAALDSHSRRNADIYYYTPHGKKLRSTREVGEHLSGTGLTLENFSFFKEPLGIDDPEKEIIRDAKMMRKAESPVTTAVPVTSTVEGKRTPKPKAPKGASPEPATPKSPPAKIKVKSVGSRLSGSGAPGKPAPRKPAPAPALQENNNSAAWKKPRQPAPAPASAPPPALAPAPAPAPAPARQATPPPAPPPPLQSRPQAQAQPDIQSPRQLVQPCSMTCGRGVPTLACAACLCLYHPACVHHTPQPGTDTFYCKNCRKSTSPPREPPPLIHKSGAPAGSAPPAPRRVSVPVPVAAPVPVPVPVHANKDKRVLLRMKVAGGGPDGERVWAVAPAAAPPPRAAPRAAPRPALPQSLAVINGRRFIVVPRNMIQPPHHEEKRTRGRVANGAASPAPAPTDAMTRRGRRPRQDDTDHFTAFYNKAKEHNYNVVVQIFQYVGMRELAVMARVCQLWRELCATPALWRHVRMKNSHVSDWGGLCAALKRHGTARLDLRKMLLPQNDAVFWQQFAQHIPTVDTLERIEMCRCPASAVEAVCRGLPGLRALSALAIRDALLDPAPLGALRDLHELRLKSMNGLSLTRDLRPLAALTNLHHLSLTSIKELGWCASDIIGQLEQLESLELGECTFRAEFATVLARLKRLRRLRLERGTAQCAAPQILRALATLPLLTRLELVNIDVKVGFDDALAECKNIQRLLIIPTYVSQSATTNKQVLSGVLRLADTLTHLMWGVTIELLRVTELFIDQCEQAGEPARRDLGECIPVLKPVPGTRLPDHTPVHGPPQVEILPLPTLQRLLSAQLPHTKLKLLRIPFHATWRQTLADFQ